MWRDEQRSFPVGCVLVLLSVGHQALRDSLWTSGEEVLTTCFPFPDCLTKCYYFRK